VYLGGFFIFFIVHRILSIALSWKLYNRNHDFGHVLDIFYLHLPLAPVTWNKKIDKIKETY